VVAYELLAGKIPFKIADTELLRLAVIHEKPIPIPDMPEHVNAVLQKALAKRGADRFASCTEFIKTLQSAPVSAPAVAPSEPPNKLAASPREAHENLYYSEYPDIFAAASEGTVDDVHFFLEGQKTYYTEKETRVNRKDQEGCTPLHHAAARKLDVNVLKYLVSCGANVNAVDNAGWTPLHYAAEENPEVGILEFLISMGADVRAKTLSPHWGVPGGKTPLDFATAEDKKAYLIVAEELANLPVNKAKPATPETMPKGSKRVRSKVYVAADKRLLAVCLLLFLLLGVMFAFVGWRPNEKPLAENGAQREPATLSPESGTKSPALSPQSPALATQPPALAPQREPATITLRLKCT
jgi:hypothetical protein